jgi:hypothetical protein
MPHASPPGQTTVVSAPIHKSLMVVEMAPQVVAVGTIAVAMLLGGGDEDMYTWYMIEMTQQTHVGVGIGPHYNKMSVEYLSEIESYSDKDMVSSMVIVQVRD